MVKAVEPDLLKCLSYCQYSYSIENGAARERGHRVSLLTLKSLRIRGARIHERGGARFGA